MEQRGGDVVRFLTKGVITMFFSQMYALCKKFSRRLACVRMGVVGLYVISRTNSNFYWPRFRNAISTVLSHCNQVFIIMTNDSIVQNWWVKEPTKDADLPLVGTN